MTEYERIRSACLRAMAHLKRRAPYDTGNLHDSIKILFRTGEIVIYVSGADGTTKGKSARGMAPYMKYTNEPWSQFKPPLKGKQNPNQGWYDDSVMEVLNILAADLGGDIVPI